MPETIAIESDIIHLLEQIAAAPDDNELRARPAAEKLEPALRELVGRTIALPSGTAIVIEHSAVGIGMRQTRGGQEEVHALPSTLSAYPGRIRTFAGHADSITACAFSPDGSAVLSASADSTLRLWDAASGHELRRFTGHTGWVTGCALSPDGARILSASRDATLRQWDAASGHELRRFTGHTSWVTACAFSPDGTRILSASQDSTLRLWDAASGRCLRTFTLDAVPTALAIDHARQRLAIGDEGARIFVVGLGDLAPEITSP